MSVHARLRVQIIFVISHGAHSILNRGPRPFDLRVGKQSLRPYGLSVHKR